MHIVQHLKTLLLITLLAFTTSGVVNAKVASGLQNLVSGWSQGQSVFNLLLHQEKVQSSYDDATGSSVVTKRTRLESRGYRPAPEERTIQGQVDAATQAGNPTVQRGGQDLFRLRSSGHGQAGATATPQNVYRTNPRTGERFGPQSGPDRAVTNRDIRELYKAQTNHGTSSIRFRSGR